MCKQNGESDDSMMKSIDLDESSSKNEKSSETTSLKKKESQDSSSIQFILLVVLMFIFFGLHNLLQEAMMNVPGFNYSVMLGYMEVFGVTLCSFLERRFIAKEITRIAPLKAYPFLAFCLLISSSLSNMSLTYINYPTKVVFRSCKLIPTMILSTFINKRKFSSPEYICAFAVCTGLVLFGSADWQLSPSYNPIGLVMVIVSVFGDSVLPNLQESLFSHGSSRLEVTFYTNLFTLGAMTVTTCLSGDLLSILKHASKNHQLAVYMIVYIAISYLAISSYMLIIKRHGAVVGVLLGTARKAMTLILSFLFFPKQFCWLYVIGAALVLGGICTSSLIKHNQKQQVRNDIESQALNSSSLSPIQTLILKT